MSDPGPSWPSCFKFPYEYYIWWLLCCRQVSGRVLNLEAFCVGDIFQFLDEYYIWSCFVLGAFLWTIFVGVLFCIYHIWWLFVLEAFSNFWTSSIHVYGGVLCSRHFQISGRVLYLDLFFVGCIFLVKLYIWWGLFCIFYI